MKKRISHRTRLKLTLSLTILIVVVLFVAIFRYMESLAITSIASLMTILATYIWGETKRPSSTENESAKTSIVNDFKV